MCLYLTRCFFFHERVFPFASLHPNTRAQLRSEIALLPESFLNPNASFGDAILHDQHLSSPISTNDVLKGRDGDYRGVNSYY